MHPECGEAYFRELCEQIGVALVATDLSLNIQTWNAAAGRMFGAAAELQPWHPPPICTVTVLPFTLSNVILPP